MDGPETVGEPDYTLRCYQKMGFHCFLFVHCKCKHVDKLLLENKTVSLCVSFNNVVISFIFDLFVLFALVLCVTD